MTESFWQRLLRTFLGMDVRLQLRGDRELVGTLEHLADDSCRLQTEDGKHVQVDYFDLRGCEAAK